MHESADLKEVLKRLGEKQKFPFDERMRELPENHKEEERQTRWNRTPLPPVVE
jgi:hypothetical protein